jgi:transglutaminase-like putative cysteine protease
VVQVTAVLDRPQLLPERHTLPLVWMPWQHQMMTPYLLPPELPENELRELGRYAMAFAERNHGDLLETLDDLTTTICRDFAYTPGFTTFETTPYHVFATRAGVCQDFANVMICACRLLQIPARYRVGYIFTGSSYQNEIQSESSHAWVEVYIPHLGWRGYDPTNGCRAGSDHVRIAAGRNYRDATPTAGVIRQGGLGEILETSVHVEDATPT